MRDGVIGIIPDWFGYLIGAVSFTSLGAILGGVLGADRATDTYNRIETLERAFLDQAQLLSELSAALARLLSDLERSPHDSVHPDNVRFASSLLARVRTASPLENMIE